MMREIADSRHRLPAAGGSTRQSAITNSGRARAAKFVSASLAADTAISGLPASLGENCAQAAPAGGRSAGMSILPDSGSLAASP